MKDLAKRFLSETDRKKIMRAVEDAEKKTSGEIVPLAAPASYHYPMGDVTGAAVLALPSALILTWLAGSWLWIGPDNLWLFLGLFAVLFAAFHFLVRNALGLKHFFVSEREMDEEVREAAVTNFFKHGLHRTRDETGVLVYVSVFERKVWILADRGVNEKVGQEQWDGIVAEIISGIKDGRQTEALCAAIEKIGDLLAKDFPIRPDDANELKNLIVES